MIRLLLTSGSGPVEVRRSVAELARAVTSGLPDVGIHVVACLPSGDPSAPRSVEVVLCPDAGSPSLGPLLGTHAFVRPRARKRSRKRWFVGVVVLPDLPVEAPEVRASDLRFRADRAGGPGGQHVNTTASAVRVTHVPSGLVVRVASERSQARNRAEAVRLLGRLLHDQHCRLHDAVVRKAWLAHHRLERGRAVVEWRQPVTAAGVVRMLGR